MLNVERSRCEPERSSSTPARDLALTTATGSIPLELSDALKLGEALGLISAYFEFLDFRKIFESGFEDGLSKLSDWFEIDLSTAVGTDIFLFLKPRNFLREAFLATQTLAGEGDFFLRGFTLSQDFLRGIGVHVDSFYLSNGKDWHPSLRV